MVAVLMEPEWLMGWLLLIIAAPSNNMMVVLISISREPAYTITLTLIASYFKCLSNTSVSGD